MNFPFRLPPVQRYCLPMAGLMALFLGACAEHSTEEMQMEAIAGTVSYRERILMRPGAQLTVVMEDVSRADAAATEIARTEIDVQGGPPFPFTVRYDPTLIDPRMRYALRVRLTDGDSLVFGNDEFVDAFGEQPIEIILRNLR